MPVEQVLIGAAKGCGRHCAHGLFGRGRAQRGAVEIPPVNTVALEVPRRQHFLMQPSAAQEGRAPLSLVEDLLAVAPELVHEGWCQGAAARDEAGKPVSPESTFARSWSAPGALELAWANEEIVTATRSRHTNAPTSLSLRSSGMRRRAWNDADGRTVRGVLDALAEAALLVAGSPEYSLLLEPTRPTEN